MGRMVPKEFMRLIEVDKVGHYLPVWPYYFNLPLIYYFMHKNGLTPETLAKKLKVPLDDLIDLLEYRKYKFSCDIFNRLSKLMDCSLDYILLDDFLGVGKWNKY